MQLPPAAHPVKGLPSPNSQKPSGLLSPDTLSASSVNYIYVNGYQTAAATGASAKLSQAQSKLATVDYHSLAELAVESSDAQQIVEVGWTVDRQVNADAKPHLFVYHWVDGQPTCYNACGFVQVSPTIKPGMPVTVGQTASYKIAYKNSQWQITYSGTLVGYFPASLWGGRYTKVGLTQVFGEVAAASLSTCTDMGNGKFGSSAGSARVSGFHLIGSTSSSSLVEAATASNLYNYGVLSPISFRFGGPGACV